VLLFVHYIYFTFLQLINFFPVNLKNPVTLNTVSTRWWLVPCQLHRTTSHVDFVSVVGKIRWDTIQSRGRANRWQDIKLPPRKGIFNR